MIDYQTILQEIQKEVQPYLKDGKIADYIPALANVKPDRFAMSLHLFDGRTFSVGEGDYDFSIQSISKVFAFTMALGHYGEKLHKRVGHEPSGNPFNSLIRLEQEDGVPRNPFINSGAIVTVDALYSLYGKETFSKILSFVRDVTGDKNIFYDREVFRSELESGYRNFALINMIKSYKNIKNNIDDVMDTYFKQCSIVMNSKELAKSMLFLANHGVNPLNQKKIIAMSKAKRINSLMLTCGHYDASGEFAYKVGLPGKSGVGGGIVAVVPNKMAICVYSPRLNEYGNSLVGTKALELFTTKTKMSIF